MLRRAHERVSEAAILLASGASADAIAEALLRALDQLDELEREMSTTPDAPEALPSS